MGKKNKTPRETEPERAPLPEESAIGGEQPKFGQALASNDKVVRDKAVKALEHYLRRAHDIEELELRKIWKALFYCMWHSDKPKVQAELAEKLGGLMHALSDGNKWLFVRVFWQTMLREWSRIDRLRLDKFYGLMRRSLAHCVRCVREADWAATQLDAFVVVLGDGPLSAGSPAGIRYFLADNFWNIVSTGRAADGADGLSPEGVSSLLEPFVSLLGVAEDEVMLSRIVDGVVAPLLKAEEEEESDDDDDDDDDDDEQTGGAASEPPLPRPLAVLAERVFSLAAAPQTADNGANGHEAAAAVEHAAAFVEEPSGLTSWGLCITAEQALVELVAAPRR